VNDVVRFVDEVPNGLSSLLGELIASRLSSHPGRLRHLRDFKIVVRASDIGLSSTLYLDPGRVTIRNGTSKAARLRVRADSATLMSISESSALPSPRDAWRLLDALRSGRLRVEGLPRVVFQLSRFHRLIAR
jgi:hypothetical protein